MQRLGRFIVRVARSDYPCHIAVRPDKHRIDILGLVETLVGTAGGDRFDSIGLFLSYPTKGRPVGKIDEHSFPGAHQRCYLRCAVLQTQGEVRRPRAKHRMPAATMGAHVVADIHVRDFFGDGSKCLFVSEQAGE
jgi:hypothetical protein